MHAGIELLLAGLFAVTGVSVTLLWAWLAIRDRTAKARSRRALRRT